MMNILRVRLQHLGMIACLMMYSCCSHDFAFDLYKQLRAGAYDKNIFFSPYSITTAMEVVYEGARGTTAQELQKVFHFEQDAQKRRAAADQLNTLFNQPDMPYKLLTANALWVDQAFTLLPAYITSMRQWYGAEINSVDFQKQPSVAEKIINDWVKQNTRGMIPRILAPHSLNELTRLVITNAIYFKGKWLHPFEPKKTKEAFFFVKKNKHVLAPFMHDEREYSYMENDLLQMIELEYAGDTLSMFIVLPKQNNIQALESQLTLSNLKQWQQELQSHKVKVAIPRIKLDTSYGLVETFKKMGIKQAFNPSTTKSGADFSGIDGKRDLYIALINHKAALDINEEGTEAAAATAVVIMMKSSRFEKPIPEFRADHPFMLFIQEKTSGTILFIGCIVNPVL